MLLLVSMFFPLWCSCFFLFFFWWFPSDSSVYALFVVMLVWWFIDEAKGLMWVWCGCRELFVHNGVVPQSLCLWGKLIGLWELLGAGKEEGERERTVYFFFYLIVIFNFLFPVFFGFLLSYFN